MATFLVLYRSFVSARDQVATATRELAQAGMEARMTWAGKAGDAIVDLGSRLSPAMSVGARSRDSRPIGGFSILQAETAAALEDVLDGHPHLDAPDASIDVGEFLPMPGAG